MLLLKNIHQKMLASFCSLTKKTFTVTTPKTCKIVDCMHIQSVNKKERHRDKMPVHIINTQPLMASVGE